MKNLPAYTNFLSLVLATVVISSPPEAAAQDATFDDEDMRVDDYEVMEVLEIAPVKAGTSTPMSAEELIDMPGGAGEPFRAVEALPGVASAAWPMPLLIVRGTNPGTAGFLVDGVSVPTLFHFGLGPSVVNPALVEALDFYPEAIPWTKGAMWGDWPTFP